MNILVETFNVVESGPVFAHDVAKALKKNGVNVFGLVCSDIENRDSWECDFDEQNLFFWKINKNRVLNILLNIFRVKRKFKKRSFDYVLYTNPTKRDLFVSRALKYNESIFILHDVVPHSSTDKEETHYVDDIMKKADNILVLSNGYRDAVRSRYGLREEQVLYMRHGLMSYKSYSGAPIASDNKIHFLFFGRIDGYKGLHVLADAYRSLNMKKSSTLTVAGNGDFHEFEKDYSDLEGATVINKYIGDEEIAYLFSKPKTVIVLPYLDATQSGVIGMAFNYECPIIATDTGGIKEQLFDGKAGLLVKPGDADELSSAMKLFVEDNLFYEKEKKKIREYKEKMTWEYITKDFIAQLEKKNK